MNKKQIEIIKAEEQRMESAFNRGYMHGRSDGGIAVVEVLNLSRDEKIKLVARALGYCLETATELYDEYLKIRNG